jgi:hypothetical protein
VVIGFVVGPFPFVSDALDFVAFMCVFLDFLVRGLFFPFPRPFFLDVLITFAFHHLFEIIFFLDDTFRFDIFSFSALFFPFDPSPPPLLTFGLPRLDEWLGFLGSGGGWK